MSERDLRTLLDLVEKHLGAGWRAVVEHLRETNGLADIERRVERGDIAGAIEGLDDAAKAFAIDAHAAYVESGQATEEWLRAEVSDVVRFDAANARAAQWAQQNQMEMVREISTEQREMLRRVHADGVAEGRNPREIARDMRDSLGLTDHQSRIVANYRTALETGDYTNALGRELTDGRSDRSIAAARDKGTKLSQEAIDTAVERYRSNWVGFRAETIARTEGLRTLHAGNLEAMKQAVDDGHVEADALEREWNHAGHGKDSRPGHVQMQGQKRGLDEAFTNPLTGARLLYPGDQDAGAAEVLNCRCAASTRIVG